MKHVEDNFTAELNADSNLNIVLGEAFLAPVGKGQAVYYHRRVGAVWRTSSMAIAQRSPEIMSSNLSWAAEKITRPSPRWFAENHVPDMFRAIVFTCPSLCRVAEDHTLEVCRAAEDQAADIFWAAEITCPSLFQVAVDHAPRIFRAAETMYYPSYVRR